MWSGDERTFGCSGGVAAPPGRSPDTQGARAGVRAAPTLPGPRLADLVAAAGKAPPRGTPAEPLREDTTDTLAAELAALHGGHGNPDVLVDAFRESLVLVPTLEGGLLTATSGGVRWVYAFSDGAELVRFASAGARDASGGGGTALTASGDVDYVTVRGKRLLDEVVPAIGAPAGVALDVAGPLPMLFPPVTGVVPDTAAVDAAAPDREDR